MFGYFDGYGFDVDGWLIIGDFGSFDVEGCLIVIGWVDDMLISGGCNVYLLEVEFCFVVCFGVCDVVVIGCFDLVWGDLVVVLIVGFVNIVVLLVYVW